MVAVALTAGLVRLVITVKRVMMKPVNYFHNKASGLKQDIERHRKEEKKLEEKIQTLESKDDLTEFDCRVLKAYKHFLYLLLLSKAEAASKIGKS